jgi:hypothetical protein
MEGGLSRAENRQLKAVIDRAELIDRPRSEVGSVINSLV